MYGERRVTTASDGQTATEARRIPSPRAQPILHLCNSNVDHLASCPDTLLDTYESERRLVARRVIALTDLLFWAEASTDPGASFVPAVLAPLAAPALPLVLGRHRLVAAGVRVVHNCAGATTAAHSRWMGQPGYPDGPG